MKPILAELRDGLREVRQGVKEDFPDLGRFTGFVTIVVAAFCVFALFFLMGVGIQSLGPDTAPIGVPEPGVWATPVTGTPAPTIFIGVGLFTSLVQKARRFLGQWERPKKVPSTRHLDLHGDPTRWPR